MKTRKTSGMFLLAAFLCLGWQVRAFSADLPAAEADKRDYARVELFSDPHLPGKNTSLKDKMLADVNSWRDVDLVAVLGDICYAMGTEKEYKYAAGFFGKLAKPSALVTGNHDFMYEDAMDAGKRASASESTRKAKLERFSRDFGTELYYTKKLNGYLLVFLSANELRSENPVQMSNEEYEWLKARLAAEKTTPTIVFFHAPLCGTAYGKKKAGFCAQDEPAIDRLLSDNPQVFLWVSGHSHITPDNKSYAAPVNTYKAGAVNIHNPPMQAGVTNSLYLYPDRVVVRTYDHSEGAWLDQFQRTVYLPRCAGCPQGVNGGVGAGAARR